MVSSQPPNYDKIWDLCIVGTGPVGIALAMECERLGREVLVLESGGAKSTLNPLMTAALRLLTHSIIVQWKWPSAGPWEAPHGSGRRCIPFNNLDFTGRDFVPDSKWPIHHEDTFWYEQACKYMLCGDHTFKYHSIANSSRTHCRVHRAMGDRTPLDAGLS